MSSDALSVKAFNYTYASMVFSLKAHPKHGEFQYDRSTPTQTVDSRKTVEFSQGEMKSVVEFYVPCIEFKCVQNMNRTIN